MAKFSVIIPCYNSYSLMKNNLKSLQEQTYKNFEVIIVDDCSTDDSYANLIKYAEKSDNHIKVLKNQKNVGPGGARNHALEFVKGSYILFLDSDDYLTKNCLEVMNRVIETDYPDLVIFDYVYINKKGKRSFNSLSHEVTGNVSVSDTLKNSTSSICCKVFKSSLILDNEIKFPILMRNEDMVFNKIAISFCEKIYYLKEPLYCYCDNVQSIMHNYEYLINDNDLDAFNILRSKIHSQYKKELEFIFAKEVVFSTLQTLVLKKSSTKIISKYINIFNKMYTTWASKNIIEDFNFYHRICLTLASHRMINSLRIIVRIKQLIKSVI